MAGTTGTRRERQRQEMLALVREWLPEDERGSVPVPVLGLGDDLRRTGRIRGGGRALLKRLRTLEREGLLCVHAVRGHHTWISWPRPKESREDLPLRDPGRPPTQKELYGLARATLLRMLDLTIQDPLRYWRLGLAAAKLVYKAAIPR